MSINLKKGQKLSLEGNLSRVLVGLGWDTNRYEGSFAFDLDASVFMLNCAGKLAQDENFIFYNNTRSRNGAVIHTGDNRTGAGEGDDEQIFIELDKVPADIEKLVICVTIHDAENRKQYFGLVSNSYIRLVDMVSGNMPGKEILNFSLGDDYSYETALVVAEIHRSNEGWSFKALGEGYQGGLLSVIRYFGGNV